MLIVAITGGPCAGKTSAMEVLRARLARDGARAEFVPEAATDLIVAGVAPWTCASMLDFQTRVIALQLRREEEALKRAAASGAAAVVCDRGVCDSRAYLSEAEYAEALAANSLTPDQALARYDAVFRLESVAGDAALAYTQENNSARFETAEEAVLANRRVARAWAAHPALHAVGNRASFQEKACALYRELACLLDIADPAAGEGGRERTRDGGREDGHGETAERADKDTSANATSDAREDASADGKARAGNTAKTAILVSACLLGEPCRYDGKSQPCAAVIEMAESFELVAACPERLGGLPTPRTPSEIQPDGRVVDAAGADRTAAFEAGAHAALRIAQERGCSQAILKENSPSCGVHRVYDGSFSGTLVPGMGKTAALLAAAGIETRSEADAPTLPSGPACLKASVEGDAF